MLKMTFNSDLGRLVGTSLAVVSLATVIAIVLNGGAEDGKSFVAGDELYRAIVHHSVPLHNRLLTAPHLTHHLHLFPFHHVH